MTRHEERQRVLRRRQDREEKARVRDADYCPAFITIEEVEHGILAVFAHPKQEGGNYGTV